MLNLSMYPVQNLPPPCPVLVYHFTFLLLGGRPAGAVIPEAGGIVRAYGAGGVPRYPEGGRKAGSGGGGESAAAEGGFRHLIGWPVEMDMWRMWVLLLGAVFFMGFLAEDCAVDVAAGGLSAVYGRSVFAGRLLEMGWSDAGYIAGGEGIPAGGCGG